MTAVNMEALLADIERRERKARTVGALLILIPMSVGLAILAYTGVQVRTLHHVNDEVQSLVNTKADLSRQITDASKALEQKKSELALANKAVRQSDRAPETAA